MEAEIITLKDDKIQVIVTDWKDSQVLRQYLTGCRIEYVALGYSIFTSISKKSAIERCIEINT